jgi:hypothetical protein
MKTSFSVKVTGSITVSIESSNENGGGGGGGDAAKANDGGSVLVDVLLKSLVNDAVKKYVRDKGITVEEEEHSDDLFSPMPQRRIPSDADDDDEEEEDGDGNASSNEEEEEDEVGGLPNVEIDNDYEEDYQLSQKMDMMSLRRRY